MHEGAPFAVKGVSEYLARGRLNVISNTDKRSKGYFGRLDISPFVFSSIHLFPAATFDGPHEVVFS